MIITNDDHDFSLRYLRKAKAIATKYCVPPDDFLAIQIEIAVAAYVGDAEEADYRQLDKQLETVKRSHMGTMTALMAKGALADLRDKGVTKENVQVYMERRIAEFEDFARRESGN
jgi:hypothetical protein